MNHSRAVLVGDDPDLQRLSRHRWTDEHRDRKVIGFECSPMMTQCVQHVIVGDTVLAGARLDVHQPTIP